jgi:error-prone DNA polymerase
MKKIEAKLRSGMTQNGFAPETQEEIIAQITSFARYGFPESHAASFALIAYASAYLKFHYLGAFTAALLNNQPMGFYSPAVPVQDAQLHGLRPHQRFRLVGVALSNFCDPGDRPAQTALFT